MVLWLYEDFRTRILGIVEVPTVQQKRAADASCSAADTLLSRTRLVDLQEGDAHAEGLTGVLGLRGGQQLLVSRLRS